MILSPIGLIGQHNNNPNTKDFIIMKNSQVLTGKVLNLVPGDVVEFRTDQGEILLIKTRKIKRIERRTEEVSDPSEKINNTPFDESPDASDSTKVKTAPYHTHGTANYTGTAGTSFQRDFERVMEVGINVSSLFTQFVPLGNGSSRTGPYSVIFRLGNNEKMFSIQAGMEAGDLESFEGLDHFNLALGYLRKRSISDKFNYYTMYNLMGFFGSFNDPSSQESANSDAGGIGAGIGFGIEYKISKNIFIGTEAIMYIGSPSPDFIPPAALYLIAHFNR